MATYVIAYATTASAADKAFVFVTSDPDVLDALLDGLNRHAVQGTVQSILIV